MPATAEQVDLDEVTVARQSLCLLGQIGYAARSSGFIGWAHELDQSHKF